MNDVDDNDDEDEGDVGRHDATASDKEAADDTPGCDNNDGNDASDGNGKSACSRDVSLFKWLFAHAPRSDGVDAGGAGDADDAGDDGDNDDGDGDENIGLLSLADGTLQTFDIAPAFSGEYPFDVRE